MTLEISMKSKLRSRIRILRAVSCAVLAFAAGCSSTNPYGENRKALEQSYASLEQGNYQAAAQQAEALYAGRADQASKFTLQRYFAAWVCAQAHVQAALHHPFLTQAAPAGAGLGIAAAADAPAAAPMGSTTSHWVAASYWSNFARDDFAAAAKQPQKLENEELLPPGLKKLSIERAQSNLNLTRLAVLRRVGAEAECAAILEASPDMLDVAKCQATLEKAELPNELRPLIFYAGFAFSKLRANPTDAHSQAATYHLGAQARVLADETPDSLSVAFTDDVIHWVEENKNFEFQCKCNKKFQSTVLRCPVCASSIVQFTVRPKVPGSP
jgi:hypothetical protein